MRLLAWLGLFAVLSLALAEQRSEVQAEDGLLRRNKLSREDIQRLRGKLHSLVAEMSDLKTVFHTPAEQSEVMRMAAKTPAVPIDSALPEVASKKEPVPAAALETSDAASSSVQDDVTMPDEFFKESKAALARLKANVIAEARAQRMEEQLGDRFSRAAAAIVARQDAESPAQEELSFAEASNEAAVADKNAAKGKSGSSVDSKAKAKTRELAMAGGTPSLSALSIDDIDLDAANDLQDEKNAAGDASAEVAAHAALIQGRAALDEAKAAKQDEEDSLSPSARKKINQMKAKLFKHKPTVKVDPKKIKQLKNNKLKLAPTDAGAAQSPPQLLDTSDAVRESSTGADDPKEPDPRAKDILNPDIKPETKKDDEFGDADDDNSANTIDEKPKSQEQQDEDEKPVIEPKPVQSAASSLSQDECIKKCKHGTCKDGICNCEGAWTGSDCNTAPPAGADKTQSSTAGSPQQSSDANTKPTTAQPATQAAAANTVTAQASGGGVVFDTPVTTIPKGALKLTTVLALDFETIATSGKDKDTFVNQFAADLAKAMGISQQRIQVMGVRAGSVIVSFAITPSETDTRTVGDLATQFQEMAQDPGSPLHKGIVSAHIDPSMAVRVEAGEGAVWSAASRLASPTLLSLLACVLATFLALALS